MQGWQPFDRGIFAPLRQGYDDRLTDVCARECLTVGVIAGETYNIRMNVEEGPARTHRRQDGQEQLRVCGTCWSQLAGDLKVPDVALARFDTGDVPRDPGGVAFPPLRWVEEQLLAVLRMRVSLVTVKAHARRAPSQRPMVYKGHVVAQAAPGPHVLAAALPRPFDTLREVIQVMFVAPAATPEDLRRLAAQTRCLTVRPRVIALWAEYLAPRHRVQLDAGFMGVLRDMADHVPDVLVDTALHAQDEAEAEELAETFERGRAGYARTRHGNEEVAAAAAAAADAPGGAEDEGDDGDGLDGFEMQAPMPDEDPEGTAEMAALQQLREMLQEGAPAGA